LSNDTTHVNNAIDVHSSRNVQGLDEKESLKRYKDERFNDGVVMEDICPKANEMSG